jgi:hypothetical protein
MRVLVVIETAAIGRVHDVGLCQTEIAFAFLEGRNDEHRTGRRLDINLNAVDRLAEVVGEVAAEPGGRIRPHKEADALRRRFCRTLAADRRREEQEYRRACDSSGEHVNLPRRSNAAPVASLRQAQGDQFRRLADCRHRDD